MTIKEAIDRADELSPNTFSEELKLKWLSTLDHHIFNKIISTHEDASITSFDGYNKDTDKFTTELLAPEEYADMYLYYIFAQIDYHNREYNGYNSNATLYDSIYQDFASQYNRTHMPITAAREVYK